MWGDITELCSSADPTEMFANVVVGFCFEMLCILSEARMARTGVSRKTHWTNPIIEKTINDKWA